MKEESMRELIALAAEHYNAPPADVPRSAMWERVRLARDFNRETEVVPRERIWRNARRFRAERGLPLSWLRIALRVRASSLPPRSVGYLLRVGTAAAAAVALLALSAMSFLSDITDSSDSGDATVASVSLGGVAFGRLSNSILDTEVIEFAASGASEIWYSVLDDDPVSEAYRRAASNHLQQSIALVAGYGDLSTETASDRRTIARVRTLLSNTRLLLSSQAAVKVQYRAVFQDLEFVLVRMTLVAPNTALVDREHISQTIERRRLVSRMRDLVPTVANSSASAN